MSLYHDNDAHREDLTAFQRREREREIKRKIRKLDLQFCGWLLVIFVLSILLSVFR